MRVSFNFRVNILKNVLLFESRFGSRVKHTFCRRPKADGGPYLTDHERSGLGFWSGKLHNVVVRHHLAAIGAGRGGVSAAAVTKSSSSMVQTDTASRGKRNKQHNNRAVYATT